MLHVLGTKNNINLTQVKQLRIIILLYNYLQQFNVCTMVCDCDYFTYGLRLIYRTAIYIYNIKNNDGLRSSPKVITIKIFDN